MARRRDYPEPKGPAVPPEEGRHRFEVMRDKAKAMLSTRPLNESAVDTWNATCINYIEQTFGEGSSHLSTFIGRVQVSVSGGDFYDRHAEQSDAERLSKRINVLDSLIELIDTELSFAAPKASPPALDFWTMIHPSITQVAKPRFDAGQFADAVEAALKHVNSKVKEIVHRKTGKELDGASLMRTAFSPKNPIIVFEDLRSESGQNVQEGYMEIFAGSMTGIRNPKAHDNISITANRAIHFLFLASLLLHKLDERE